MFELPEFLTLAGQINAALAGKAVEPGAWATAPQVRLVQPPPNEFRAGPG